MKDVRILLAAIMLCVVAISHLEAQRLITRNGHVWFHSSTPIEDIEAHTYQAMSVLDTDKGEMAFAILMMSFQFEKALMQEHFNEKYVESEKYPKATFKGRITNWTDVKLDQAGEYPVKVEGTLDLHGEAHPVSSAGKLKVDGNKINGQASFRILLEDYKIKVPSVVRENIAEVIDIVVDVNYEMTGQKS